MHHPLLLLFGNKLQATKDWSFLGSLPSELAFARASAAWRFNEAGVLTQAATNEPRFDYDPVTLAINGLLLEEQRTNSARNSTMQGTAEGTPGTTGTYLSRSAATGVTLSITGVGVEYGMPYMDARWAGTPSGGGQNYISWEQNNGIAAVQGEVWTHSLYTRIVGGSTANITNINIAIQEYNSTPSYLAEGSAVITPTAAFARFSVTRTLANAACACAKPLMYFGFTTGQPIDITFRLYQPQMEKGGFATSPIVTTGATVTRAADSLYTASLPWFNAAKGSFAVEASYQGRTSDIYPVIFSDGGHNNQINVYLASANGKPQGRVNIGGSGYYSGAALAAISANAVFKQAMRYKAGDNYEAANGSLDTAGTLAAASLPSGMNRLDLGSRLDATRHLNGWLRRFRYWNYGLADAQLQQVTQ